MGAAYGGAIYNGIGSLQNDTKYAIANAHGEISATIGKIIGDFKLNSAHSENGNAFGGAIYNGISLLTGNLPTEGITDARIGAITGVFSENRAAASGMGLGGAIYNSGSIGWFGDDDTAEGAYDGTVTGGVLNSAFYNNVAEGTTAHGGGIWTSGRLAIVANGGNTVFSGNMAGAESSGLYIGSEDCVVYLIAQGLGTITFDDIIEGTLEKDKTLDTGAVSTLRLRGYTQGGATPTDVGGVYLNHYVKNTHVLMDDVTLYLGVFNAHNPQHTAPIDKTRESQVVKALYWAENLSHILENSNLTTQSGVVNTVDVQATNYLINRLVAVGKKAPGADGRYATFAIDILPEPKAEPGLVVNSVLSDDGKIIQAKVEKSDLFTVGQDSKGYVTLSQLSVHGLWDKLGGPEDGTNQKDDDRDYGYEWGDRENGLNNYDHLYVQVINYVGDDYDESMRADEAFKIQLDLSDLNAADYERAHMNSRDVLAKGIDYVSVKTYHDGVHLLGWRDPLAAWAELDDAEGSALDAAEHKSFIIYQGHTQTLTRNINILDDVDKRDDKSPTGPLMTGTDLRILGEGVTSVLNVNRKNMLTEVAEPQNVRLQNLMLINVQDDNTLNSGNLTFDTVVAYSNSESIVDLVVDNHATAGKMMTVTGHTNLNYTITTLPGKDRAATYGDLRIDNSTQVSDTSVIRINHEVSHQNITHSQNGVADTLEVAKKDGVWQLNKSFAEAFETVTYLPTTGSDKQSTTHAFDHFTMNELRMEGGAFSLGTMYTNRLQLRNFHVTGGGVFVDSSTIDISLRDAEVMGGIDVLPGGQATYAGDTRSSGTGNGLIWLERFALQGSSSKFLIHVKFVDPGVADAVKDGMGVANGGEKSGLIRMADGGGIWMWEVTYNDDRAPQKGMYTLSRIVDATTPEAKSGAVTQLAGSYVSMMQVYNYAFEHADLFSAGLNRARRDAFYAKHHVVVTPTKGKDGKGGPAEDSAEPKSCRQGLDRMSRGLWLHTYASTENMPLHNGPKVRSEMYGGLLGGDSELKEHDNGWASVYSLYGGYIGSTQRYDGVRIRQNGGALGFTGTFYYKNFYTALTGTLSTATANVNGSFGRESFDMYMGGLASRSGYNIELDKEGDYILQPTLLLSYTCFSVDDYKNASGVKMKSRPVGALQLHPYLKFISNADCTWKPYASVGFVYDVMGKTKFKADGTWLPSMSVRPYVEYSVGTQYLWSDTFTIYGQITGRNGGRNGAEANIGLRWAW